MGREEVVQEETPKNFLRGAGVASFLWVVAGGGCGSMLGTGLNGGSGEEGLWDLWRPQLC